MPESAPSSPEGLVGFDLPAEFSGEYLDGLKRDIDSLRTTGQLTPIRAQVLEEGLKRLNNEAFEKGQVVEDCRSALDYFRGAVFQDGNHQDRRHFDTTAINDAEQVFLDGGIDYISGQGVTSLKPASYYLLYRIFQLSTPHQ